MLLPPFGSTWTGTVVEQLLDQASRVAYDDLLVSPQIVPSPPPEGPTVQLAIDALKQFGVVTGTWTPIITPIDGGSWTILSAYGLYIQAGNMVFIGWTWTQELNSGVVSQPTMEITGLPTGTATIFPFVLTMNWVAFFLLTQGVGVGLFTDPLTIQLAYPGGTIGTPYQCSASMLYQLL